MPQRKIKKRKIILVVMVVAMFFVAYAHHRFGDKPAEVGRLQDKAMDETSGIVASAVNSGVFYVHNDSGDTSRFFAINENGKLKTTYYFKGSSGSPLGVQDCEDIAIGPGPIKNKSYLYLGDIGDNGASRKYLTIYRFAEPKVAADYNQVANIETVPLYLKYPDGPKDAETMMIDPLEKLLYIVSKRKDSVSVYTSPLTYKAGDTVTMTYRCKLHFKGLQPLKWITAGDISADGKQILLKNYVNVYYWRREAGEPVWKAMMRNAKVLDYEQEKQGEAIGFSRDGKSYYTTSEGVFAPIYRYTSPGY
ncbi:hypothetical protein [Mucilaginibacter sp. KACC 22063]|uniref:hypothetical protein n=1 Tax=Mucilaginibacter sp. KACC 22063 TaxID=3025666 RepID=UPI0023668212|nr:hypothetical protein [Mucilaginibacter sp. KACC 22063]WDF56610.1 hypothetical protein PQ461_06035 [Mucilaginibacter sp. KACC 22063]